MMSQMNKNTTLTEDDTRTTNGTRKIARDSEKSIWQW